MTTVDVDAMAIVFGRVDAGSHDQIAALFDEQWEPLCRLAYLLVGDSSTAEDVVQEAFLGTFVGWSRIRRHDHAERYLRRAVVNRSRSRLRRRPVERRANEVSHFSTSSETGDWTELVSISATVAGALLGLAPRQRAAVVLRYYVDLPEAEIAATLGVSVGTVKSQLAKARRQLAKVLEP
jgi:RNA polymerase sigma-70 factor (sigma-E family)